MDCIDEERLVDETPFMGESGFVMGVGVAGRARGRLKNSEIVCRSLFHPLEFVLAGYELPTNSQFPRKGTVHIRITHFKTPSIP